MIPIRTHSTTAELDLRVEYDLGPEGPEIRQVFIGELTDKQRRLILEEILAVETRETEAAELEHQLARRDLA